MSKRNTPTIHEGKAKWMVRQMLAGDNLDTLARQVKANEPTIQAAQDVYAIALRNLATKVA